MGGLGTRFRKVGVTTPKPLIEVDGVPMFQRALRSFAPWEGDKTVTVVVRADDDAEHGLARRVTAVEPSADIVLLDHDTSGAVETCLEARDRLDPDQPLVIMDCDIAFDSPEYFRVLADAGRVRLILALLEGGELCVCDLAAVTGLSQTACSHNLRLLRAGRIVRYRRSGRNVFYTLDDAHIRLLLDVGLQHLGHEGTGPGRG